MGLDAKLPVFSVSHKATRKPVSTALETVLCPYYMVSGSDIPSCIKIDKLQVILDS